jgi:uncharacterized phiE125 gp8 family phage protein
MGLIAITQPTEEPLTLDECRTHLRVQPYEVDSDGVGTHPDDALIMAMQAAAREYCEAFTGLSLAQKTYELALDAFPSEEIEIPTMPVVEIVSVTYVDANGTVQTIDPADYTLDAHQKPSWLLPTIEVDWPVAGEFVNAVKIRYVAGYGLTSDSEPLPYAVRAAVLLMLGHLYANREDTTEKALSGIPSGVESLLRPLRVRLGMA